jgi:tetratricopeptide (TPR) repeat protein
MNPLYHNYEEDEEALQQVYASRFYNQVKNYKLSMQVLKNASTDNVKSLVAIGQTYLQYAGAVQNPVEKKSKSDTAEMYLKQALETDADEKTVHSSLGSLYALKGDFENAAHHIGIFLSMDKSGDYMYYLYGYCNRALWRAGDANRLDDVIKSMKASLRLNPNNGKAYLYMAEAYVAKSDNNNARIHLNDAIKSGNPWTVEEQKLLDKLRQELSVQ